jgi:hypothetical protein
VIDLTGEESDDSVHDEAVGEASSDEMDLYEAAGWPLRDPGKEEDNSSDAVEVAEDAGVGEVCKSDHGGRRERPSSVSKHATAAGTRQRLEVHGSQLRVGRSVAYETSTRAATDQISRSIQPARPFTQSQRQIGALSVSRNEEARRPESAGWHRSRGRLVRGTPETEGASVREGKRVADCAQQSR